MVVRYNTSQAYIETILRSEMTSTTSGAASKLRRFRLSPSAFFLVFGLLVGGIFCVAIPYGAGFDEETHLVRIWEISGLHFMPNQTGPDNTTVVPRTFFDLSYQRRYFLSPGDDLFRPPLVTTTIDRESLINYGTRSIYPPVSFLPQAFVVGVAWRFFDLPIVPAASLARLAGLLIYIVGAYLSIRLVPSGKWVMAILAISPMALYQAATLNADAYTNAVSLLFIGYTIKVFADRPAPVTRSQVLILAALIIGIGLAKQGAFVVLPLLFMLAYQRFPKKGWFVFLWGMAIASVVIAFGWSALIINRSGFGGSDSSTDVVGHIKLVLANPLDFLFVLTRGVYQSTDRYFHEWVGVYGHWLGIVPDATYWIYLFAVLVALFAETKTALLSATARLRIIGVFLAASGALIAFFYLVYYQVGITNVAGVQGRYFIALTPLLYIPLAGWLPVSERVAKIFRNLALVLGVTAVLIYSFGMYATYYTECASSLYTGGPCYQPIYKNIDKANSPAIEINQTQQVTQTFLDSCGQLEGGQVWIQSINTGVEGNLRFDLVDDKDQVLFSQVTPMKDIPAAKYFSLAVSPPVGQSGRTYKLRLSSTDTSVGKGVKLAFSVGDYYSPGALFQNQQMVGGDLVFKYVCVNPWKQGQLLPMNPSTDSN